MIKDRLGNALGMGDRLCVTLPEALTFGFVAEIKEQGVIRRSVSAAEVAPGHVLVSCVLMLPVDPESGQVAQCVKVYDPNKRDDAPKLVQPN